MRALMRIKGDDPTLALFSVLREDGTADPQRDPFLPKEMLLAMYEQMLRIRRIDERMLGKQRQGKVGFYGTITGQEATPIATGLALAPEDWVFPALREAAIMLVRGFPLGTWLAQVYGNHGDLLKGRQMPSHQSGRAVNQVAWSSCIGPQIPQAVGAAMAAKAKGDKAVSVGFMGDGATSQPDFHAAMTFAGIHKPPVVLICQNNHWSISVPTAKQTASKTIAVKAHAYGIRGVRVDGNDVLAVYRVVKDAVDRARAGEGPTFVESLTYRMGPHSSSDDPTRYRSNDEVESWAKKDPLARFERYLQKAELLDDATKDAIEARLRAELDAALAQVEELGPPARETVFEDVYASLPAHLAEQRETLLALPPAPLGHH
ncbi:Branched-chain alpha-keto acid dehydrogenase, E1 component, alpha subunit [Sandaracinus amylolyticus]|uniref:2-oxoisovalerate dehydrogenase subunit alpha n=2 Tax=Sandaracinus amylolyticus TaxID=927083 RepID=A0A0F6YK03_9BACT|nr:Branched-chain alpha-keto acid dehydrogenase, E1 component, alpha subunit [Sandaracinus amylolyticus]